MVDRRQLVLGTTLLSLLGGAPAVGADAPHESYGSVGRIKAKPGRRDALAALVIGATSGMPGCRAYVVSEDLGDPDALWVFEAWDSKAAHDASLSLPAIREAIAKGRPLIAQFDNGAELRVLSMATGAG